MLDFSQQFIDLYTLSTYFALFTEMSPVPLKKSASENTILQFQKLLTERVHTVTEGKKLLLEKLCKQEEMQDLNRTQLYADPSAIQQVGLMNFLPN